MNKSFNKANEPLPDTGLMSASGKISLGNPNALVTGDNKSVNISKKPDALNIDTAVIKPINEGAIENIETIPSFAPSVNASKSGTFLQNPKIIIKAMETGTTKLPIISIFTTSIRVQSSSFDRSFKAFCCYYSYKKRQKRNYPYSDYNIKWLF